MASTTITYGKKRSLLSSLGSRRRHKPLIDSLPAQNPDQLSPSVINCHEFVKQTTATNQHVQPASIEEIASALLDDSTSVPRADVTRQSEKDPFESFISASPVLEHVVVESANNNICSPQSTISRGKAAELWSESPRPGPPRVQKSSPRKALERTPRVRSRTNSSPSYKESGLIRPLISPVKPFPDRSWHNSARDIESACLLPHNIMDGTPGLILRGKQSSGVCEAANSDEVQEKVCAMLAATDSLKPSVSQLKHDSITKASRITPSRVLAKVSNAWERLHAKQSSGGYKTRNRLTKQHMFEDANGTTTSNDVFNNPAAKSTASINTIEIRLNEGDNLNRRKVQKMVGGRVARKPVADEGKSLRSGQSIDDPFAEPATDLSLATANTQSTLTTDHIPSSTSILILDPFEYEKGFEQSLEDRILSTLPGGASTPRIWAHKSHTLSFDKSGSGSDEASTRPIRADLERVTIQLAGCESEATDSLKELQDETSNVKLPPFADLGQKRANNQSETNALDSLWTKKHPSPSKRDLENLSEAFHLYSELKRNGAGEEADELAGYQAPPARMLSPLDTNRLMKAPRAIRKSTVAGVRSINGNFQYSSQSRITRSISPFGSNSKIRLATPYRPMASLADETDELQ